MCTADKDSQFEREVSSSTLLPRLKAQVVGQVKDTQRTPAQSDLITTWHARQAQLFYFDNKKQQRVLPCKLIS